MGSKKEIKKVDSSKYLGYIVVTCIALFIASFIYKFTTTETIDSNLRWCPNHNTYHNITKIMVCYFYDFSVFWQCLASPGHE